MNYCTLYTELYCTVLQCSAVKLTALQCTAPCYTSGQKGGFDHGKREEFSSDRVKNTAESQDLQNFFPAVNDLQNSGLCTLLSSSCRQRCRKWVGVPKNLSDKLSSTWVFGLWKTRNLSYCQIFYQLFGQRFRQCCVQQSDGWTVLCPIVQMLDNALSNCAMVGQRCVQQSNGESMLCPTVQWLVIWVFNCPMVGLCFV